VRPSVAKSTRESAVLELPTEARDLAETLELTILGVMMTGATKEKQSETEDGKNRVAHSLIEFW
jgi:hypothetical protein